MDGYAVVAAETKGASNQTPIQLEVLGTVTAGSADKYILCPGKAVAIATGARVPQGADAVVMVENTRQTQVEGKKFVTVYREIEQGKNVSQKGEDLQVGKILLQRGTWLRSQDIGLIASVGVQTIDVFSKPQVAVFSTGSELVEVGANLTSDVVLFDSNRYMLSAMIRDFGGEPVDLGICADDEAHISETLTKALNYDLVVMSGGSSVGEKDYAPKVINALGKPGVIVHGVAMRPGSPTGLSILDGKPVISAPGYPVAAYFAFLTFGKPLLYSMQQTRGLSEAKVTAKLTSELKLHGGMRAFVRVKITSVKDENGAVTYLAEPVSAAGASMLSTLTSSDAVLIVDGKTQPAAGQQVEVTLLRPPSEA